MSDQLQKILSELQRQFLLIYGDRLFRLVLYGSHARDEAEPGSDIDVMVVLRGRVNPSREIGRTGEFISDLSLKYDVVVSCLFISASRFARSKSPLLLNVRKEGIAL